MPTTLDLPGTEILWRSKSLPLIAQMKRERKILSRIVDGDALADVLDDLLREIETSAGHGLKTSILELSEDGQRLTHLAGPTLPATFKAAIDGVQIGEGVGSCGTVVHRDAPVYVSDIENDPLWTDYRNVALAHDLRACWSTPIHSMGGEILGTFAIYYHASRSPGPRDIEAISAITLTVALAIERHRLDVKVRRLSLELSEISARSVQTPLLVRHAKAAVNSPLNRMQVLLHDPMITGASKQRSLTEVGRKVLELARLRLEENRRILGDHLHGPVRVGIGSVFIDRFTQCLAGLEMNNVILSSGICFEVADAFANEQLDLAYVFDVKDNREKLANYIVDDHSVDLAWVKTETFEFVAGKPVPLAVYPGDNACLETLKRADCDFRVMFSSKEYAAKLSAVRSGKYITAMPRSLIEPPFEEIEGGDLPRAPSLSILTAVRGEANSQRFNPIVSALAGLRV